MTDKVIIDGIDVSKCMWFIRAEGRYVKDYCCCYREFDICQEKTDCYYKQLQRKTAECEELKEQLEKNRKLTLEYISSGEKYLKALDEIENFAKRHCNTCEDNGQQLCSSNYCYRHYLLDIINKAKDGENE